MYQARVYETVTKLLYIDMYLMSVLYNIVQGIDSVYLNIYKRKEYPVVDIFFIYSIYYI
jgi:hypothetical protein